MAEESEQDDKTEEPTQKRLDEARKRGDVVRSQEVASWFGLTATAIVLIAMSGGLVTDLGATFSTFLSSAHDFTLEGANLVVIGWGLGLKLLIAIGGAFAVLALAAITQGVVQDKFVLSAQKMKPDLQKLNPISGFKRMFGPEALTNLAKSIFKMVLVGAAAWFVLYPRARELENAPALDPAALLPWTLDVVGELMIAILIVVGLIAAADYALQRHNFFKRLRMTREEIRREYRETEGDPHVRARLRQIRRDRSRRRMLQAVPQASVVIANPTHYAVALKYEQGVTPAPICVAKGADELALRIRETAEGAGVPVVEDPPLARALFATAEIDAPIPRQHYEAAAKVIGFVMNLARKRGPSSAPGPAP